jgi:hypothetical protein
MARRDLMMVLVIIATGMLGMMRSATGIIMG